MMRNKLIALLAGLSLALVSSVALAAPSADTLLVAGYDSDQMAVIYGVSGIDQEDDTTATLDCSLVGTFGYTVGDAEDGIADVETLTAVDPDDDTDTPDDTTFEPETVIQAPDNDPALADVEYGAEGAEECSLTSVDIEPNGDGEINHGTIVSTFANLLQGGKGCIIRHFAQSDFGKADYDEADVTTFEVTLQSIMTSCEKGKDRVENLEEDDSSSAGKGKANAPGQLKDKGRPDHVPGPPAHAGKKGNDSSSEG